MQRIRFFEPHLLKVSFFFALLVLLFLLLSFVMLTPEHIALANLVQKINTFFSWPSTMLEGATGVSMSWTATALWLLIFWSLLFSLLLSLFVFLRPGKKQ